MMNNFFSDLENLLDNLGTVEYRSVSADYSATEEDRVILVTSTCTITLPDPTKTLTGRKYTVKAKGSVTFTINNTIDGVSGYTSTTSYEKITIFSDGEEYLTI